MYHQVSPGSTAASRRPPVSGVAMVIGLLLGGVTALGQPAPAGTPATGPNWDVIRKGALSPIDKTTVQKWVTEQIDQIFAAQDPAKPGAAFYKTIAAEVRNTASNDQYKGGLGQIIQEAFAARYQKGEPPTNPLAPLFPLMALREFGPPATAIPTFQAVLADQTPAVRCQGILGINAYALQQSVPPATRTPLVDPIRKAALTETCPVVMARLYGFLKYVGDNGAAGQDLLVAQMLVAILDARLTRVEKEGLMPTVADAEAINWLAAKSAGLNSEPTRRDIARVAARLLADAAYLFANSKPPQQVKQDLEKIVFLTEDPSDPDAEHPILGLADLCKAKNATVPSPSVTEAIKADGDRKAKVDAAVAKWIGVDQTKGVLNDAFGLPIGLGIQRSAPPTTQTAPAA